ncbi:hypothetical protein WR164_03470 [Philodulcilactobacillus myokoensis]|uniref:Uncharacterized protein n=2 Tax=Philodulcilactobacillus myokoensis TaxID=2929573 RepID=A0A9W6B0G3_9LACO|nr:hypothetical protein WR164_03470 [Philodulcilactobacillus myokoensis]
MVQLAFDYQIKHHLKSKFNGATKSKLLLHHQHLKSYRYNGSLINIKREVNFARVTTILYLLFGFIIGLMTMNIENFNLQIFNVLSCLALIVMTLVSLNREVDMVAERNYFADYLQHHPKNELNVALKSKKLLFTKLTITLLTTLVGVVLLLFAGLIN